MATKKASNKTKITTLKPDRLYIKDTPVIQLGIKETDYQSTPLHEFLDKRIYKIEYETVDGTPCINYIDNANKHVVFQNKTGIYTLFHLENGEITEQTKDMIIKALLKKRKSTKNESLCRDTIILQSCVPDIDLSPAQDIIVGLNRELAIKCPDLYIKIAPFHEYTEPMSRYSEHNHLCIGCNFYDTLILSLCRVPKCISTIELKISPTGEVIINSKTDSVDEGKKYNKMLRAVLFIIAEQIPRIEYIKSIAVNPISAWLLIKYSHATVEPDHFFETYLTENNYKLENLTQEQLAGYYAKCPLNYIHLIVPIGRAASDMAYTEFRKLIAGTAPTNEITC